MKEIRCSFKGYFYTQVEDNISPQELERHIEKYINTLEEHMNTLASLDEYSWEEVII